MSENGGVPPFSPRSFVDTVSAQLYKAYRRPFGEALFYHSFTHARARARTHTHQASPHTQRDVTLTKTLEMNMDDTNVPG